MNINHAAFDWITNNFFIVAIVAAFVVVAAFGVWAFVDFDLMTNSILVGIFLLNLIIFIVNLAAVDITRKNADVSIYLDFQKRLNEVVGPFNQIAHKFNDATPEQRDDQRFDIELGQKLELLLATLEAACNLYNNRQFHGKTREMIRDTLGDHLPSCIAAAARMRVDGLTERSLGIFEEIRKFAQTNNLKSVDGEERLVDMLDKFT